MLLGYCSGRASYCRGAHCLESSAGEVLLPAYALLLHLPVECFARRCPPPLKGAFYTSVSVESHCTLTAFLSLFYAPAGQLPRLQARVHQYNPSGEVDLTPKRAVVACRSETRPGG